MKSITASDRTSLIRLASGLPKGDTTRRAILAGLAKTSAPKVKPELHPLVAEGNFKFVQFADEVIKAVKGAVKPQSLKGGFSFYRDAKKTFYICEIKILNKSKILFTVQIQYSKDLVPQVHLFERDPLGPKISIPTSTGINPDGTIGVNTSDPGKLIKFLLGYLKENTAGTNIFKGDDANPAAPLDEAKTVISSVFAAFKKLAKASGVPLDTKTDKYPLKESQVGPSKWAMSRDSVERYSPEETATLKKAWDVVTAKYAPKLNALGVSSSYIAPELSKHQYSAGKMRGTGFFILEVV